MGRKKKENCEKYGLAITDYVLGEDMDISKAELVNHLKSCSNCREDLQDWENTYAALRTKEHCSRPEIKAKMDAFIKEVTSHPVTGKEYIDLKTEIGTAAGRIWDYLAKTGETRIKDLYKKTKLPDYIVHEAIGWLAKEEKLTKSRDKQDIYVSITEREREQRQM